MASSTILRVASFQAGETYTKTDLEMAQIYRWFVADIEPPQGLTQAELNQWYLDQTYAKIKAYVLREARHNRLNQLKAQQASIEEQATNETAF